jgi:hypothetical protein
MVVRRLTALIAVVATGLLVSGSGLGCNGSRSVESAPAPVPEEYTGPPWFDDVTRASGIAFSYRNGEEANHYSILESLGGGVALIDYDGDGLLDVFLPGGGFFSKSLAEYAELKDGKAVVKNGRYVLTSGHPEVRPHPCKLYRNLGQFKFQDVTDTVMTQPGLYTHGAAVADYDRDGFADLLVTGWGRVVVYHNEADGKGGRKLRDVTADAGLTMPHTWATSAAFGDLDGDGYPDLYVCQYVNWSFEHNNPVCAGYTTEVERDICPPKQFDAAAHRLYRNLGPGADKVVRFKDVSAESGLRVPPRMDGAYGKGLGVVIADVNGDGKPDIYVANDTVDNFLYLNQSTKGAIKLDEKGFDTLCARDGTGTPNGSMGVDVSDFDGSGLASIWVTNYEGELHSLYRNGLRNGRLAFRYHTQAGKIAALGQNYVGFGTAFLDLDRDGWDDLLVLNGHVIRHPHRTTLRQKPVLLRNNGDATFSEATARGGSFFKEEHRGRGLAVGDLDNDGRPDVIASSVNEPVRVLKFVGDAGKWIGLDLRRAGDRDATGSKVTVEAGGRKLVRFAKSGGSYLSANDRRVIIGLGAADKTDKVTVEWSHGAAEVFTGLSEGSYWRLTEGSSVGVPVGKK